MKNPVEAIVGERVKSVKYTHAKGKCTGNLVLTFECGKELFIAPITSELFFSPVDENVKGVDFTKEQKHPLGTRRMGANGKSETYCRKLPEGGESC